jgi:hypothetical protein
MKSRCGFIRLRPRSARHRPSIRRANCSAAAAGVAAGTSSVMTCFARSAQRRAKFSASRRTRFGSSQEVKTFRLSQFLVQPTAVSFRLPLKATLLPSASSTTPAFS